MSKARQFSPRRHGERYARPLEADGPVRLYGIHAVAAALCNPARIVQRMMATPNAARRLAEEIAARGIAPEEVTPRVLDRLLGEDTVHQGVLLETEPLPPTPLDTLSDARLIVALDQITDPQNVGALVRLSAVFGADAVVITRRNSPPLSDSLAKAASGGLEHVPVVEVQNLARGLAELGDMGFTRVGLSEHGMIELDALPRPDRSVLVLGAEGRGLRNLTQERCDVIASLGVPGPLKTLNVATAAAVALYILSRSRPDG